MNAPAALTPRDTAWAVLSTAAAGDPSRALTMEEAQAVRAELWDARGEVGRATAALVALRKRHEQCGAQHDQLVAQVISEELHRVDAERRLAEATTILIGIVRDESPLHWRTQATKFVKGGAR